MLHKKSIGITGMGIVSSIGNDIETFTHSLQQGISGIQKMSNTAEPVLAVNIAAEIRDFSFAEQLKNLKNIPEEKVKKAKRLGQRAPFVIQTTILAALQAWAEAGLFHNKVASERIGLVVAGQNSTQNYQYKLISEFNENPEYLSPRYALEFLETNQVGVLSELFEIEGEGVVVGGASATGNVGIIKGHQLLELGNVDVCLVVGVPADLSPLDMQGFINIGAMGGKTYNEQPTLACRPFDKNHEGFVYGQASTSIVLETQQSSEERSIASFANVIGYGYYLDKNSSANPNLAGEEKAMQQAMERANITNADINYINTHGSSSPLGDQTEAEAIYNVFTDHLANIHLNATKGLTGHCLYTAGMVEVIATVLQMKYDFLHPNINLEQPIRSDLQFCGNTAKKYTIQTALSNSFGFGGINTSIALKNNK
ncbi:beta-ketoacyl synthase N-terminal-like domain-containing protein [Kordia algicida OT-1]|uniref:Beta-ketoacyl-ACP synthase n=1 Tax=Kordia algicida OT-1 TaxID=391587 RepID=A9EAE1_9FLAO|nr:beta-ketoacyl synthase N-terminal-like domain-containing protein [Kordia algicida]EDP94619.1 beta-ketoacyl-ACP synthase [Kordia algicida OT-1]